MSRMGKVCDHKRYRVGRGGVKCMMRRVESMRRRGKLCDAKG